MMVSFWGCVLALYSAILCSRSCALDLPDLPSLPLNTTFTKNLVNPSCEEESKTIESTWDKKACRKFARKGLWDSADCNPDGGSKSCETVLGRGLAWSAYNIVHKPDTKDGTSESGSLVLFLPGTGASPSLYSQVLKAASAAGHYVVGLSYLSQVQDVSTTNAWCEGLKPEPCTKDLHNRMISGKSLPRSGKSGKSGKKSASLSRNIWNVPKKRS
eukprot:scaffold3942_cov32-Attheya_sp.AAC.1